MKDEEMFPLGGQVEIPPDYKYLDVYLMGPPEHHNDAFLARHPRMDLLRRAKIFAPFDALKGYSEAIAAVQELYEEQSAAEEERA